VEAPREAEKPSGPPPYSGKLAEIMDMLARGQAEDALVQALGWRTEDPGDIMALIALGEALEASGNPGLAARAYGSIIDLFPSRADMRRFAGQRLERLGTAGAALAADTYAKSVAQRPDHLTGHRLLAFALLRKGDHAGAFAALEIGLGRDYPAGRFNGGERILREDLGLVAAAWVMHAPAERAAIERRLAAAGATLATRPSLRFVLNWETDANDVDFHIYDGKGGHAFYSQKALPSGGELYEDVTTGFGPECFTIEGVAQAYPYTLQIHYYSRGPMGYGMGKLEIIEHDGAGNLRFEQRPYVVMNDGAYVDLGTVARKTTQLAR
jgi:tetratricopeptide (TPR) repeat protein